MYDFDGTWTIARDNTVADSLENTSINAGIIVTVSNLFLIQRGFLEFDLSEIPSAGRVIDSVRVEIIGNNYADAGAKMTLQAASGAGPLTVNDYNNFSGSELVTGARDWELWDGGNPNVNKLFFNITGENFIKSRMGDWARVCCREYEHDYLNVEATVDQRMGCYFAEEIGGGSFQNWYAPRIVVKYYKSSQWLSAMGPSYWTVDNGSWDGSKYTSGSFDAVYLIATGAWILNFNPSIFRVTFDTAPSVWVEFFNTFSSTNRRNIAAEPQREDVVSGEQVEIINYNNGAIDKLQIFNNGSGAFNVTNIEFLIP
jgi:hypothetical protein